MESGIQSTSDADINTDVIQDTNDKSLKRRKIETQSKITSCFHSHSAINKRHEKFTDGLVKMVAMDLLPFNFVHGKGFRELMTIVDPQYIVPSGNTIASRIDLLYNLKKKMN